MRQWRRPHRTYRTGRPRAGHIDSPPRKTMKRWSCRWIPSCTQRCCIDIMNSRIVILLLSRNWRLYFTVLINNNLQHCRHCRCRHHRHPHRYCYCYHTTTATKVASREQQQQHCHYLAMVTDERIGQREHCLSRPAEEGDEWIYVAVSLCSARCRVRCGHSQLRACVCSVAHWALIEPLQ